MRVLLGFAFICCRQQRSGQPQLAPTAQMRYAPQGSPNNNNQTHLLGDISPGRPQVAELSTLVDTSSKDKVSADVPHSNSMSNGSKAPKGMANGLFHRSTVTGA